MTDDDQHEFLLSCRYGDLDDVERYCTAFPDAHTVQDDHGNTPLHMAAANGHLDVLAYLLPRMPKALCQANHVGSTPLHWAAVNRHLDVVQALVRFPSGPGIDLIDVKNTAGRTPLGEAELAGWDEGARWLVQVMKLDDIKEEEGEESIDPSQAIQVEIQDAEGQVARMSIDPKSDPDPRPS